VAGGHSQSSLGRWPGRQLLQKPYQLLAVFVD
jgi:hypothetical protein